MTNYLMSLYNTRINFIIITINTVVSFIFVKILLMIPTKTTI